MAWSASATAAGQAVRKAAFEARVASGKKHCARHDDGAGAWLPLDQFNKSRNTPDGLFAWCRTCTAEDKRRKYAADPGVAAAAKARAARYRTRSTPATAPSIAGHSRQSLPAVALPGLPGTGQRCGGAR